MATKVEKNVRDPLKPGEDYKDASGRDHPAESEHDHAAQSEPDHARQKLNGESAKMAKEASEAAGEETSSPRKA